MNEFEGDILLTGTEDGGDIRVENGLIVSDRSFATAVYLSLFGGNKVDAGKGRTAETWWGNTLYGSSENEKVSSRFQSIMVGMPLTVKNIRAAETAALMDLQWVIDEGLADNVFVESKTTGRNQFHLKISLVKDRETLFSNDYAVLWRGE
jgi:phage gp46-like protein